MGKRDENKDLGWDLNPFHDSHFPLSQLPPLSAEEKQVCQSVLERFYAIPPPTTLDQLEDLLEEWCREHRIALDPQQREEMGHTLTLHAFHAGPLTEIFQHPQIEEIGIYGIGKDFPVRVYHTDHGWMETPLYFTSASVLITLLNRMVVETGRRLSTGTPLLNAPIPGYGRMHASIAPVCLEPVEATIRRMIHRPTDTRWLVDHGVISPDALVYLEMALQLDCNLLLAGNTGSGKTTTLNTLLHCLPMNERFIVIEETPELELQQPHTVRLVPDPEGNAGMPRLIRETLRMRPDRVVVGEIRHPEEAFAFIEAVLAGQGKGTYATFHGHSSHETIARLRGFGIPEQDLGWLNILVVQRRWGEHRGGKTIDRRAICEIGEVFFDSANKLVVHPVFTWSPTHRKLLPKQESVLVRERFGWNFPGKQWIFSSKKKKSMSTPKKGKPDAPKMDK